MAKLIRLSVFILYLAGSAFAQPPILNVTPLVSSRSDVIREYGIGKKINANQTEHLTRQFKITITYVKGDCSPRSALSKIESFSKVLEAKMVPNQVHPFKPDLYKSYSFNKISGSSTELFYFDRKQGVLLSTQRRNTGPEYLSSIFLVPKYLTFSKCAEGSLFPGSAIYFLRDKFPDTVSADIGGEQGGTIGRFFEEDDKTTKDEILSDFVQKLKSDYDRFGYIVFTRGRSEPSTMFSNRKIEIINFLDSNDIDCRQYLLMDGQVAELGNTSLAISRRSDLPDGFENSLCRKF